MQKYLLDMKEGKIGRKESEGADGREGHIWLMKPEEFKSIESNIPYKRNLCRSMCPVQYCKVETFDCCVQGTMKVPRGIRGEITFLTFAFYMSGQLLILIEEGVLLKTQLEKMQHNSYGACSMNQFLQLLFELLIEDDVLYLQQEEERLSHVEEALLKKIPEHFYESIIHYRKCFSAYHSYYEQLMNIGDMMQSDLGQKLTPQERAAWQFYANRAERLHNHVEMLREYLVQIRDLYQSLIDVQQNKVMSILTVVTTIFLPLTLIAGWYGMNFPNMPELHWRYGYPVVIFAGIIIIILEIIYFKKKKML